MLRETDLVNCSGDAMTTLAMEFRVEFLRFTAAEVSLEPHDHYRQKGRVCVGQSQKTNETKQLPNQTKGPSIG